MAITISNAPNSFVTFYDPSTDVGVSNWVTDTPCGIQKEFCLPVNSGEDIQFQTNFISDEDLESSPPTVLVDDNVVSGATILVEQVGLYLGATPIYNVFVSLRFSDAMDFFNDGDCFQISLTAGLVAPKVFISNQCFKKINDTCLTSRLTYSNNSNAFGFYYIFTQGRQNAVRLPVYFKEPTLPVDKTQYLRSNGTWKTTSARLTKRYKGILDHVTEEVHSALNIALNHDNVRWETENNYAFNCNFQGEYNNDFPNIMQNVNIWSADFTIFETPYNNVNSNCG